MGEYMGVYLATDATLTIKEKEGEPLAGKEATDATLIVSCKRTNPTGLSPRNQCIWTTKERGGAFRLRLERYPSLDILVGLGTR